MIDKIPKDILCEISSYIPSKDLSLINKSVRQSIYENKFRNMIINCERITKYNKKGFLKFLKQNVILNKFINIKSIHRLKQIIKIVNNINHLTL